MISRVHHSIRVPFVCTYVLVDVDALHRPRVGEEAHLLFVRGDLYV